MKFSIFSAASLLATAALAGRAWEEHHGLTFDSFKSTFNKLTKDGYRPIYLTGDAAPNGDARYNGIFKTHLFDGIGWTAQYGYEPGKFGQTVKDLKNKGYFPMHVQGYNVGKDPTAGHQRRFNGIWHRHIDGRRVPWELLVDATKNQVMEAFGQFPPKGYRLVSVSGYGLGSEQRFTAAFQKTPGPEWKATIGMGREEFQKRTEELRKQGFFPADLSVYNIKGSVFFSAIWQREDGKSDKSMAKFGLSAKELAEWFRHWKEKGYEPMTVSGYLENSSLKYAAIIGKP
ncbi:hypothetical protein H112_02758 [Trichophyton rubrum D6]|uniref:Uncharacterized protein n=3 Tax=Trichophyton rubrum TaxID=5551 RepID=A0A178EW20_TRIRU|nr:uncharacterized protein TERG_05397 [Trichophyton rubrum CBS 118892]EZF24766.1 hypothetical protein H100_02765 [Trichophyton rubrum MR850]EZF43809.1 hypothetical protein H102_02757 [Trichophyton rubrum CBS 100081]EZF54451.1 hypothetical protein H103_02769 [Trichophyton rubrum CBS 288.86]EZF65003.1 hypothetical protein H104_02749 [Trichophyton rubrum CBS 289.86]EZF86348.1 hypothetical protein H110_02767 [Trichophyton rubrum MR1448]EZF96937.1 hypothetical protein H113_02769 [Trichophyton rubr